MKNRLRLSDNGRLGIEDPDPKYRAPWWETFMAVAQVMSNRATCPRLRTGAVIATADHQIVASGYNGAPRGLPHCDEVGCLMEGGHCVRAVHAEANAILQAARRGVSLAGTTMYTLHRPCIRCAVTIVQSGVMRVEWLYDYDSDESRSAVVELLKQASVSIWYPGWPGM